MKGIIIAFIILGGIWITTSVVYDIINGIIQSKKWSKTKNEIIEYLKTLGNSEVVGYSDNVWEAQIIMTKNEIEKNIKTLFAYSWAAIRLHKVFDWKIDGNTLIYKITA